MQDNVTIPDSLVDEILAEETASCDLITASNARAVICGALDSYRFLYESIEPFLSTFDSPKLLEIGSGNGLSLCYMLKRGVDARGVEPGEGSFSGRFGRALRVLEANGIEDRQQRLLSATAEHLPFPDLSFDMVVSTAVLEHVQNVENAVREAVRVTRPGGLIVMSMPNYNSFYEGHYRMLWLPYVLKEKPWARWYVGTLRRRPVAFLDELNFTTPRWLARLGDALPDIEKTDTYYGAFSRLGHLTAMHRALALRLYEKFGRLAPVARAPVVGSAMLAASRIATQVLAGLGLCPVFTVVFHKGPPLAQRAAMESDSSASSGHATVYPLQP